MDRRTPVYLRGFSFGPCFDFLGRNRIGASSLISNHSLQSVSVLVGDPFRGRTYQLLVPQPGSNPRGGERIFRGFNHTSDHVFQKYVS